MHELINVSSLANVAMLMCICLELKKKRLSIEVKQTYCRGQWVKSCWGWLTKTWKN